ncbi:MAG: hypothetical protein RR775_12170 [Massilia sp.]|uniref:hypothetical protein n=1 Tax=Massilia sp. TaxID=1882437 RepID=UPI002FC58F6D
MKTTVVLGLLVSVLLVGCSVQPQQAAVPTVNWDDPAQIALRTEVKHDEFKKVTEYRTPSVVRELWGGDIFIRGWKNDGETETKIQIYVIDNYAGEWRFYNSAYDSNGNKLSFQSIDRSVLSCRRGCTYSEHLAINVSKKYLQDNGSDGIRFKISGKAGETVKFVPAAFIKGFLSSIDKT